MCPAISSLVRQQMALRPVGLLQTHVVHHRHQVQVDRRNGIPGASDGQGGLRHPGAPGIVPLEIEIVGLDIQRKGPQPRRQQLHKFLRRGQSVRQRQMEQHRGGGGHEAGRRLKCRGGLPCGAQRALHLPQGGPGLLNAPQRQVGKGVDQAGGQPRPQIGTEKIALRLSGRLLRVPAEVVILRQGDVPLRPLLHGLHGGQALSRHKGRIHQRHKVLPGCLDRRPGHSLHGRRPVPLPVPGPAQVLRLGGVRGDRPGAAEFLRPLNAALCTQFLNQALGHAPSFRRLSNRFVAVHAAPAFPKIPAHRSAGVGKTAPPASVRNSAFSAL